MGRMTKTRGKKGRGRNEEMQINKIMFNKQNTLLTSDLLSSSKATASSLRNISKLLQITATSEHLKKGHKTHLF